MLDTLLLRFHAEISARRGDGLVVRERIYSGEPLPCAAVGSGT